MPRQLLSVGRLRIASPCQQSWNAMPGDDRVRFCSHCGKNVYNLSALDRATAQTLVHEHEGRLCVRFYQRSDGTVLTADCPIGKRRITRRVFLWGAGIIAFCFAACMMGLTATAKPTGRPSVKDVVFVRLRQVKPLRPIIEWLDPTPPTCIMGPILSDTPRTECQDKGAD